MDRRNFLGAAGAIAAGYAVSSGPVLALSPPRRTRTFTITTSARLAAAGESADLYVPLFADVPGQKVLARELGAGATLTALPGGGGPMVQAVMRGPAEEVRIEETVEVADRASLEDSLDPATLAHWTRPEERPGDAAALRDLAQRITAGLRTDEAKARAIYRWVIANTWRDEAVIDCGTGNAGTMIRTGAMGGKCADINSLLVCLCRAAGIPARDRFGIRLGASGLAKSMGATGDVSGAQHCRAEVWLREAGWVPVDAADVRKVMLSERRTLDDPRIATLADRLFGFAEGNWGFYNDRRDLALGGGGRPAPYDFLMYPTAMGAGGWLCREALRYRIEVREIAA